jgi:hypothetical protein
MLVHSWKGWLSALPYLTLFGASLLVPVAQPIPARPDLPAPVFRHENATRIFYPRGYRSDSLADGSQIKSLLKVGKKMRFGEYVWNDRDIPGGPARILVDLSLQTISVFRDGHEIGTAVILYGSDHTRTPTGTFKILERARYHRSNLYDADMNYMLRLTMDGVAIHASSVREGFATHGCIGIPNDFASRLFDVMRKGDMVTILPERRGQA